ncbi:MAG TPA: FAD-dependent monooxygenase [Geodermatophilus sp.]|nr:FAD-dependent monooxygenase [Geodermatophilus sp.]
MGTGTAGGVPLSGIRFTDAAGRQIGHLDGSDELARYGARNHLVRRDRLQEQLRRAAEEAGVRITADARVVAVEQDGGRVVAPLADGTTVGGDVLLGADGVHSTVRRLAFPEAPQPACTGILNCGGWAPVDLPDTPEQHMVFGRRGFFGYVVHDGLAYWFSNVAHPEDPSRASRREISGGQELAAVRAVHAEDPDPVPAILAAATSVAGVWPVYDVRELPTWHTGRICLLGDAAHATSPNAGQGASLALEDAVVLAACLRDLPDPAGAFATFEGLRKERAERIVRLSRRLGRQKVPSRAGAWFRDRMLPLFLKAGAAQTREQYGYRFDFDAAVGSGRKTPATR